MTDYVNDLLREILTFACQCKITGFPSLDNTHKFFTVIVGSAADTALCTSHSKTRKNCFVLPMKHVILAVLVQTALVVLVQALESVFDSGEVRHPAVNSFQQTHHRKESAIECRNMIIIERQRRCTGSNFLDILHQLFDAADLRERRSHSANAPCSDLLSMLSKHTACLYTATAHMHNHLKALGSHRHPAFRQLHALFFGEHIALSGRTVDEHTLKTILL